MSKPVEKIDKKDLEKYKNLREVGQKHLDDCLQKKINSLPTLERLASLSETGRLELLYATVGQARLEGHSWRAISAATTGKADYLDGRHMQSVYLSFCRNNSIEPVKIRKDQKRN